MIDISGKGDVFGAISAPARRAILGILAGRELPVMALAESFQMSLPAVSQHLGVLRDAGLVTMRKAGRQRIYKLNPAPLRTVSDWVSGYEQFWGGKLVALGQYLDDTSNPDLTHRTSTKASEDTTS